MTLYEATMMAGIPNAPSVYAPTANINLTLSRQKKVISTMVENEYLTQEQADELIKMQEKRGHLKNILFIYLFLVGRDGFEPSYSYENRFLTTIVFTTIFMFVVWTFSFILYIKIPGIKSLHSKFLSSSGLSSAYTVKTSPN